MKESEPEAKAEKTQLVPVETVTVNAKGEEIERKEVEVEILVEDLGKGVELEMVFIPQGTFMMGSPEGEGYDHEKPQHEVTVPSFFMGKYPVTQAQWRAIALRKDLKCDRDLKPDPSRFKGDHRPVEWIIWDEAVEFCARLSKLTGQEYRLPSEAEWEYACRAGTTTPFSFGETLTDELANCDARVTYADEPKGQYRKETTPVGSFPPNAFGLHDMHGNVWEWCADDWHSNYESAPTDGSAWLKNSSLSLLRGGSWLFTPDICRSACRSHTFNERDNGHNNIGFRVGCGVGI